MGPLVWRGSEGSSASVSDLEYPHRRYLLYLLSRRLTEPEILNACMTKALVQPKEEDLRSLRRELGAIPSYWRADLGSTNTRLYRWLRDLQILDLWKRGTDVPRALEFIYATNGTLGARPDFEHLMLLEWNVEKAREQLALKYGELRTPSLNSLKIYAHYFWNLSEMSQSGIFTFLETKDENETALVAFSGDLAATYGMLGLRHRIEDEEFYDNVIALANEQVQLARLSGKPLQGQRLMGIAGLARVADDAIQQRRDMRSAGLADTIRGELAAFRMRKRQRKAGIPSYEDLVAQEAEEEKIIDVIPKLAERSR
jgi:hypothetical protein